MVQVSLYRKYRPATFDDVVGQQHIERTLRNAVAEGTVAHAYLFTGPRGTGKTTTARLLAKALMCERGSAGEPDGTCEQCVQIAEGRHPDVYELDAASRTGVDNVREEIIGRVSLGAVRGHYKVYIIDEVHMLSAAAFNALLKTIEEPPGHVVFVMCTTHSNKVPETVQSRCQRFDFHRFSVEEIVDRLRYIAEAEGLEVDRSAFTLIARHADGGMRDAITALEQLVAFSGSEITADDVEGMLGQVDAEQLFEFAELIVRRDIAGGFHWIADVIEAGVGVNELVREFTAHIRDLFVIAASGDGRGLVNRTTSDLSRLEAQATEFGGPDRLAHVLHVLGELAAEMRWSSDPRLSLEIMLTRVAQPQGDLSLAALAGRLEALEQWQAVRPAEKPAKPTEPKASGQAEAAAVSDEPVAEPGSPEPSSQAAAATSDELTRAAVRRDWQTVLLEIKKSKPARAQTFANTEVDVDTDGRSLVIAFPASQGFSIELAEHVETRELMRNAITAVFGSPLPFRYQLRRGGVRPTGSDPVAEVPASAPADPVAEVPLDPIAEVPAVEDPVAGDPAAQGLAVADPVSDGCAAEEPVLEEPVLDATGSDAPKVSPGSTIERILTEQLGGTILLDDD
ncbi:MAG: DNA polymerase III subunit gamma/tau [Coriobacteriia bacterium]|nr:DNA polymerase III subunit gamma/tau [Coriobacteriia bacterium]